jgi:hypothetical protein
MSLKCCRDKEKKAKSESGREEVKWLEVALGQIGANRQCSMEVSTRERMKGQTDKSVQEGTVPERVGVQCRGGGKGYTPVRYVYRMRRLSCTCAR